MTSSLLVPPLHLLQKLVMYGLPLLCGTSFFFLFSTEEYASTGKSDRCRRILLGALEKGRDYKQNVCLPTETWRHTGDSIEMKFCPSPLGHFLDGVSDEVPMSGPIKVL